MSVLLATADVESVSHILEGKDWHNAAYLRKHSPVHQVEHYEYHPIYNTLLSPNRCLNSY